MWEYLAYFSSPVILLFTLLRKVNMKMNLCKDDGRGFEDVDC